MANGFVEEFAARVSSFRAQDEERFEWMQRFYAQIADLSQKYKDCCNDLERERIAGRETQKSAAEWERQYQQLQQTIDDSSFVLVLIDADADEYIFKYEYYVNSDGGRKAAGDLQARVRDYLETVKPGLAGLPIAIKAFANGDGMSKFLSNVGVTQSSQGLGDFAKGFSQSSTSDFVFVGNGKNLVDKKINAVFKQFVKNPACRHIVFGACHDNDYVRVLEDYTQDSTVVERITLLRSFNIGREFRKLPFQVITMDGIFGSASPKACKTAKSTSDPETFKNEGTIPAWPRTWASLAKSSTNIGGCSDRNKMKSPLVRKVLVNATGARVDEKLPRPPLAAVESWKHKVKKAGMRYCRMYQLNDSCQGGCGYSHGPLTDDEKLVYRLDLRDQVCHEGLKCRDINCDYGHNCSCKRQRCWFSREMHGVDGSAAEVVVN